MVGNVMVRTSAGSFNEEGTQACFRETQQLAPRDRPWVILADASLWTLSNLESLKLFPGMREWAFTHGCQKIAMVMPSPLIQTIHQRNTGNFPQDKVRYFPVMQEAIDWLADNGFVFDPADYPHHEFLQRWQANAAAGGNQTADEDN